MAGEDVLSSEQTLWAPSTRFATLDFNLHSLSRQLIELRMAHGDLDAIIDRWADTPPQDELMVQRMKKRRLALRDQIARLERLVDPQEPA